ncbi:MAG TPA: hypothetical protein VHV30_14840 [Polyangiaceae bacterium]|nr:hypothetical protein [Polyangiaceae bacterium]
MRSTSFVAGAGVLSLVASQAIGCSAGGGDEPAESASGPNAGTDLGIVGAALTLPGGEILDSATWTITGPNGASTVVASGEVDLQDSQVLSFVSGGIPAGSGYEISVSAVSADGTVQCVGSATFAITAHQTTNVTILVQCTAGASEAGAAAIGAQTYACAVVGGASANPNETTVGFSVGLSATAIAPNPASLTYAWSAPSGSFNAPGASTTDFTCAAAGPVAVTVTVSDGPIPMGASCNAALASSTVTVQCDPPADASAGDAASSVDSGVASDASDGSATSDASTASDASDASTASDGGNTDAAPADSGSTGTDAGSGSDAGSDAGTANPDVVVYRVGDGSSGLVNTGVPVFVDEFDPTTGALVKSTEMPTAASGANHRLFASGTATSEGLLTTSADGRFVILTGYDAAIPVSGGIASSANPGVPRVVGRLDAAGNVDTSTALTDIASKNNIRGATSSNGVDLWATSSNDGLHYASLGSTTSVELSTTVTNLRGVGIFGSQLYVSDSSGSAVRLGTVGAGLPKTSGQTTTNLPGFPLTGSPYGFFFADLDGTPGVDTVYVADDGAGTTSGGLFKFALVAGTWTAEGSIGATADAYRGVTGVVNGTTVTLYATRKGGTAAAGGGELDRIVDASGFGGTLAGAPTLLATAAANTAFRGVAVAPHP